MSNEYMDNPLIFQNMINVLKDLSKIGIPKNRTNSGVGYKFRGIDDIYNTLSNLFSRHEIFMVCKESRSYIEERGSKKVLVVCAKYSFIAKDGSFIDTNSQGEGLAIDDKASGKAQSNAHKYALLQALCIPTDELKDIEMFDEPVEEISEQRNYKVSSKHEDILLTLKLASQDKKITQELFQRGYDDKYKALIFKDDFPTDIREECLDIFRSKGVEI